MPGKAILLDANLLVLLIVGTASKDDIARHKRLGAYSHRDHDLLLALVSAAGEIVVTPNTVTEASNLLRQIGDPTRTHIGDMLRRFLLNAREDYVASRKAAESGCSYVLASSMQRCCTRISRSTCC